MRRPTSVAGYPRRIPKTISRAHGPNTEVATTAQAMRKRFSTEAPCRIVIEVGTHSPWVQRLLQELVQ
jgi:hypothetical protein